MSQSSLPDIFRKARTQPLVNHRQGSPFCLHLQPQSLEKYMITRGGLSPAERPYATLTPQKGRSASTASGRPAERSSREYRGRKPATSYGKMELIVGEGADWGAGMLPRQKSTMSVLNTSSFPFQTHSRPNPMAYSSEEAEGLRTKTDFNINEISLLAESLKQAKVNSTTLRIEFQDLGTRIGEQMELFQEQMGSKLKNCYEDLSRMRRYTNQGIKGNRHQFEKLQTEIQTCINVSQDLIRKSNNMYEECLSRPKGSTGPIQQRATSPGIDFQEISSIPKTSRGATGDGRGPNRRIHERTSSQWNILSRPGGLVLNGKELQPLSFQEC